MSPLTNYALRIARPHPYLRSSAFICGFISAPSTASEVRLRQRLAQRVEVAQAGDLVAVAVQVAQQDAAVGQEPDVLAGAHLEGAGALVRIYVQSQDAVFLRD